MPGIRMLRHAALSLTLATLVVLTGCESFPEDQTTGRNENRHSDDNNPSEKRSNRATQHAARGTALAALNALPVKGRAPMTGYDRAEFGAEWSDAVGDFSYSRNGCDTRNDILARDLRGEGVGSNGCVVISGVLAYEPYTGETNRVFLLGGAYEVSFDVEHLVALGNAWATGAQQLTQARRAELANDPLNLYLADPSANRAKGDADFATWLPVNKAFRCSYAARQIRVKAVYGLWVTAPEKAAMERVLADCPREPLKQPPVQAGHKVKPSAVHPPRRPPAKTRGGAYANCAEVIAAGADPIRRGDPGYGSHMDGDGDGVACE